jgi:hypothetical protein
MADIQKVAQFVLRAKDEASPTIKAVGETVRRLSNIKVENQILALDNQISKLKISLAGAQAETAKIGAAFSRAKAAGVSAAQEMSEYGQSLSTAQARTRALKDALASKVGQLHRVRDAAQGSFAAFSKGASALDATGSKLDRLQRELAQTEASYRSATKDAAAFYAAQRTSPGISNLTRGNAAVEQARDFKIAMREIQDEIARTNGAARGSFAAFDRVAVAMQAQTTEAIQLAPAIEQTTSNAAQNAAAQAQQRKAIDATTAAMRRQQTIAQRPVGQNALGGGGAAGGFADDTIDAYATRQQRGPLGLRPFEMTNLAYQINDVVSGFAMGQPPMQIFAQQFGQIAQLFPDVLKGFLRLSPVIGAFAVAVVAPIARIETLNNSVAQFERQLAISADGALYSANRLGLMAQELDDLGISVAHARDAISTMIKAGVVEGQIKGLIVAAEDLASVTGMTVPDAANKMAAAFTGGFEGIRELDQELNFLTASQYENIAAMFDAGNETGAYATTLSALEERLGSVTEKASGPWGRAFDNIGTAWNNFMAYMADTTPIFLVIKAIDALGIGLEKVTGLLVKATSSSPVVSGNLAEEISVSTDEDLDQEIDQVRKFIQDAVNEKKIGVELDPFYDSTAIDGLIAELQKELDYLLRVRGMSADERRDSLNLPTDPYAETKPQKTATEWAAQMDAVEAAHRKVAESTEEQKKAQIDVSRSIDEMLEKIETEAELTAMTAEERFIEQGVIDAINIAKERGVELDEMTLNNLRERLGVLYEMQGLGNVDSAAFEREFSIQRFSGEGGGNEELVAAAVAVAQQLGVSAKDILTAISYETAGTFDPWKAGPTTQWGQHRGLIQWGEPQRERYGVTQDSTITEQMEAVAKYLSDAGVKAGDGLLQIYAAINAGSASRTGATDENNGGAPGTVADKVNDQMSGHKAKAEGLLAAYGGIADETERRVEKEKEGNEAYKERVADMQFELDQTGRAEREAAVAEALRTAEKERGRKLTEEERMEVERLAGATYDAANAQRLKGEEGKRLEQEIATLLERQAFLREQIAYAQQTGDAAAMQSAEDELANVNEQLDAATQKSIAFWESMGGAEAESAILALQRTQFELGKLDTRFLMTGEQMNEFIANSATNAFTKFAEAIANGENAAKSLGDAFRQMAADILLQIGQMIVKQAVFNLVSGMFGGKGAGGGIMGLVGKLFHSGGVVGSGSGPSRSISPAAFAAAPRYHQGGIAGLMPGEVPAILKRGEEVITEDDPRHIGNGGGASGGATVINAIDAPSFVEEALKNSRGQKAILNFMRANPSAVRSALGV